ncbi:2-dehydropantoate 2-reductase [Aestuariivirga sp. YIM B02566]|uniref:2-dehydropantoate 2-reductase n=1 Tax=Taklimakanibacter albus TaxID=2800327 RepID=A0ACC5RAI8_9HYPH|nr:2-dehydropantoate 2-reductase [Aestuariivirga sp. YIM B02566]MBK1869485.1 2-dehydropantoate 2-reductase [Aestuariivirga sp. YIM B02566]
MTRICVFGAGAIGGLIGARLARADVADVALVARGAHLEAMQAKGLSVTQAGETFTVHPKVSADPRELGRQDYVILTLKAYALPGIVDALAPLIGPDTVLLFGQNGLPWWYFYKHGGRFDGHILESVDPGGLLWKTLGPERALGAVIWQAAELGAPGHIVHGFGDRLTIGEPSGEISDRARKLSALLERAGVKSPVRADLRNEIWLKLWGNLSFNPVSVLTGGTLEALARDPGTRAVLAAMMEEARAIGEALGVVFSVSVEERLDMAAKVGAHRSSMLQDVDAGRPTELDALLGAVIELAQMTGIATPALKLVYDLARFRVLAA